MCCSGGVRIFLKCQMQYLGLCRGYWCLQLTLPIIDGGVLVFLGIILVLVHLTFVVNATGDIFASQLLIMVSA